jgi:hypothetical protein
MHPAPAGGDQHRAGLADQPRAQPPPFQHQPGAAAQLAGIVSEQVAEQADRDVFLARARGRPGADHVCSSRRVELWDHPRVREQDQRHRDRQRAEHAEHDRGGDERDRVSDRHPRPPPARAPQ